VCKFYQGAEDKALEMKLKKMFAKVHREKPESSRSVSLYPPTHPPFRHQFSGSGGLIWLLQESRESFFVALRRKGDVTLRDVEGQS
jgi:21S rRNA (uridine2791-2'-O)-methyltransferase